MPFEVFVARKCEPLRVAMYHAVKVETVRERKLRERVLEIALVRRIGLLL